MIDTHAVRPALLLDDVPCPLLYCPKEYRVLSPMAMTPPQTQPKQAQPHHSAQGSIRVSDLAVLFRCPTQTRLDIRLKRHVFALWSEVRIA